MKSKIILVAILFLALFLRIYQLNQVPIELFGDEIDVGIQANSILETGQDYFGNKYPLMFQSFNEYRLPFYIYWDTIFIKLFGMNEYGVRMNSVFWGVLGIFGIYLLTKKLFNEKIGFISALFLTVSPWHLQYSRQGGIEAGALITILILAVVCFLYGLEKFRWLGLSIILFAISIYVYATAVVFVLLIIPILVFCYLKKLKTYSKRRLAMLAILFLIILTPFLKLYFSGEGSKRFSTISVWGDQSLLDEISRRRKIEDPSISRAFHNKFQTYFYEISGNYLKSISPSYLFFSGDPNLRHSVGAMGEMYFFDFILVSLGLIFIIRSKLEGKKLLLTWLILSPIPSSLTRDGGYHASRLILMLPPLIILSSLGFTYLIANFKNKAVKIGSVVIILLAILNFTNYYHRYFIEYPLDSFRFWQYGFKDGLTYLKEHDSEYSRVYMNNTYEIAVPRFLFWYNYSPSLLHQQFKEYKIQTGINLGFEGMKLGDKYYFGTVIDREKGPAISKMLKPGEVYLVSSREEANKLDWRLYPPEGLEVVHTVVAPNDEPIFFVVKKK